MYVYASLGGVPHNMILDTGASVSSITVPIANALLRRKQADVVPGFFMTTVADGAVVPNQSIVVHTMSIGRHRLHNIQMLVADDGAPVLLGLSELSAIGSFTIDPSHSQIRFNWPCALHDPTPQDRPTSDRRGWPDQRGQETVAQARDVAPHLVSAAGRQA